MDFIRTCVCLPTLLVLAVSVVAPASLRAQQGATTADVSGVVTDESGGVMAGVAVTALETSTNVARTTTTGNEGRFVLAALPPGTYTITATHPGFTTVEREGVRVTLGTLTELAITLPVGGIAQHVTVPAKHSDLDQQRTALSTVVLSEQVERL